MPEAAPSATPVAPSPTQPATPNGAPPPVDAKAPAKPEANAWTPDDDKAFEALAKKRGFKVKANGEERPITRVDDLLKEFEFAAKGRGANKLAEQTKAELEQARTARAEAQRIVQLAEAAKRGDYQARLELGLVAPDEQAQVEQELAGIPPEVRAVLEENARLQREAAELREQQQAYAKKQEQARLASVREQIRTQAMGFLGKVVESAGLDLAADSDEARPFLAATLQAMQEFDSAGLDLSSDVTAEMLTRRALELRHEASEKAFGRLKPQRRIELARPVLESLVDEVFGAKGPDGQVKPGSGEFKRLIDALGPKAAAAVAKAFAMSRRAPTQPTPVAKPAEPEKPQAEARKPAWFGTYR